MVNNQTPCVIVEVITDYDYSASGNGDYDYLSNSTSSHYDASSVILGCSIIMQSCITFTYQQTRNAVSTRDTTL